MDKVKLIALIASLYAVEIVARVEMVKNAAKENDIKEGDLYKLLKKEGYNPAAPKGTATPNGENIQQQSNNDTPPNGDQNNSEELIPWIEKLKAEPDKGKRNEIVADLANQKGLKVGKVWEQLKNAGFDPKDDGQNNSEQKVTVMVSHKTGYEKYRCAGLVLTQKPDNYLVTEAQAEKLKNDPWVVMGK